MVECWENICRPGGFEITARAAELSGWQPGDRVLDLGCGTGASLHYLEEHMGLFMQGVEADASLCDAVKILYGDASTLPAEEESVDGILMECSFSRMEQPEISALAASSSAPRPFISLIPASPASSSAARRSCAVVEEDLNCEVSERMAQSIPPASSGVRETS